MAHFYASAQGSRGETHRLGGKSSGADASVRGWHDGVRVWGRWDEEKQKNIYTIDFTGGSSGAFSKRIGTFELITTHDGKKVLCSLIGKDDIIL
jgi:hypothetical protein